MDCERCQDLLIDHAHGELDPPERVEVAAHLAGCGGCALEFCRLRADLDGIAFAHHESPRAAVGEALRARVEAEFAPPMVRRVLAWWTRPIPIYWAVAAAAAPLFVVLALSHPPESARAPDPSTPARVQDYDATTMPAAHRDVL